MINAKQVPLKKNKRGHKKDILETTSYNSNNPENFLFLHSSSDSLQPFFERDSNNWKFKGKRFLIKEHLDQENSEEPNKGKSDSDV